MKNTIAKLLVALVVLSGSPNLASAKTIPATDSINSSSMSLNSSYGRVLARSYTTHSVYLYRGSAVITIIGDGDTDLDLYVYDFDGNLIARREGNSDYEVVYLNVYRSGYFTVKVVNRGRVYNDYLITVE